MKPEIFIAFSSPAGSTRHVAAVIEKELQRFEAEVKSLDLKQREHWSTFQDLITAAEKKACLFIGSPVYRGMAVPPVMAFISRFASNCHHYAVPFATWGGASSGSALWQMGRALKDKGFELAGAAKSIALHSMMFAELEPLGHGRPNSQDDDIIKQLAAKVYQGLIDDHLLPLSLKDLNYQPEAIASKNKTDMTQPWKNTPKFIHEEKCTRCNVCKEKCPVGTIDLTPYPQFGSSCIDCFNCLRICPEKAVDIEGSLSARIEQIRIRAKARNEIPHTQAFVQQTDSPCSLQQGDSI